MQTFLTGWPWLLIGFVTGFFCALVIADYISTRIWRDAVGENQPASTPITERPRATGTWPTLTLALDDLNPKWREITQRAEADLRPMVDLIRARHGLPLSDLDTSMWRTMHETDAELAEIYETNYH